MFQRFSESLRRFMYGRCGVDQLNLFLLSVVIFLSLASVILSVIGGVCTLIGMLGGSYTQPAALAYRTQIADNEAPSLGYSTVYPLSMFLRILAGQMVLLMLL